jgi:hypothetical protein
MKRALTWAILFSIAGFIPGVGLYAESLSSGPTVLLSYEESTATRNPIDVFMYFIPLTSPVRVSLDKSPANDQAAWITGYEIQNKNGEFRVRCDFSISGDGYYINTFSHQEIISHNTRNLDSPKTTRNLDYMRFEGSGYGTIEINGRHSDGKPVVTSLSIDFANRGVKSPVIIGLYSLDPVDGVYDYENRYNLVKSRISYLSFQETPPGETPKMKLKLSTFGSETSADGFFSSVKAVFANFFLTPIGVNPVGNSVLLDFAMALYLQKEQFAFPLAESLAIAQ